MSKSKANRYSTFDMKEYFSGERFVIGGLECDWEVGYEKKKPDVDALQKGVKNDAIRETVKRLIENKQTFN